MKMERVFIVVCLIVSSFALVRAQEYKVPAGNVARLDISEVNRVSVEGHSSNDIIFRLDDGKPEADERARGLRAISSMGLEDNTGLGLSVVRKDNVVQVRQLKKMEGPHVRILVPKGVTVMYQHSSPYGDKFDVRDFGGTLEVSMVHNDVRLEGVTGPVLVKMVHGDIDASFAAPPTQEVRLESVHGHVDAALPLSTKADLTLASGWGEVLIDPDFKIDFSRSGDLVKLSDKIQGKLNGGGPVIVLSSQHNNVYVRKK